MAWSGFVNRVPWKNADDSPAAAPLRVRDGIVKLGEFRLKFRRCSGNPTVPPDLDALGAEESVAADMIEMLFAVEDA